jgi:hypothetical protein
MDLYYLITLPWSSLASREINGYEKKGSVEKVTYNTNTYVEIDRSSKSYTVVRDGVKVANDFSTMMPLPDGKILVYSRNSKNVTVELPEFWKDSSKIKVSHIGSASASNYSVKNGELTLKAIARTIYTISYAS